MARKRIKTLANDWGVPVEDILQSCGRLKLGHARSDSSLLGQDEVDRIRADLDQQAHRAAVLHRETVVETSAGKIVEKRLNATVMRRRHTEPAPGVGHQEQPFHFELEKPGEEPFVAPFLEEGQLPTAEPRMMLEPELAESAPEPVRSELAEPAVPVEEKVESPTAEAPAVAAPPESVAEATRPAPEPVAPPAPHVEVRPAPAPQPPPRNGAARPTAPPSAERQAINLTKTASTAPSLDDGQRGPKVLGKIDLRAKPPTPARPSGPLARPGQPPRPGSPPGRVGTPSAPPGEVPQPPGGSGKPPGRGLKKKVVKKGTVDFTAERELRGLRVPKKRRALPGKEQKKTEITTPKASKRVVRITEGVTVGDLGRNMGVKAGDLIKKLMELGQMATLNQVLDIDTATLLASEFGYSVENVAFDAEQAVEEPPEEALGESLPRPPVVTVMGHVDHGKTSLLDAIRHTNVTAKESGGITQHIGAYQVTVHDRLITFVDTPGHEAFTAMRARGARVTDLVILVVAANEGVMPQTVEAINHARAAQVPIIVAINKVDLPEANIDRVKQRLTEQGLVPEDYGGDTTTVPVSARSGEGIDRLLEMILLHADLMELKANPNRTARATVVESQLDRGRGPVATVLVQEGTLHQGDPFVCGVSYGRVRAMLDHRGERLSEAGPSTPVEIFGLSSVPEPGTAFVCVAEESKARQVAEYRRSKQREGELSKTSRISLEDLSERMAAGEVKELKVILKADVQGSVEALSEALTRLSTSEVRLEVIHSSAGAISETDVTLAAASSAIILGFNVRPEPKAAQLAERDGVEIRSYTVIYDAINDMRAAMEGLLAPTYREKPIGRAEVRRVFSVPGGMVAGSMVVDGKITRGGRARLVRDGRVVWEGRIGSLKRFKDDVREVLTNFECGIGLENFNDVKPGDVIESFEMEAVLRKLETPKPGASRGQVGAEKQLQT
jgi:translation initiation factor IF-2